MGGLPEKRAGAARACLGARGCRVSRADLGKTKKAASGAGWPLVSRLPAVLRCRVSCVESGMPPAGRAGTAVPVAV